MKIMTNFIELKLVINNRLRLTTSTIQFDKQENFISQHSWNGIRWSFLTKIVLKKTNREIYC